MTETGTSGQAHAILQNKESVRTIDVNMIPFVSVLNVWLQVCNSVFKRWKEHVIKF
jgi:hypothetical protein